MDNGYILIVDDEQRMRSLIKDFLKQKNYSSLEAADGEEALQVFEVRKFILFIFKTKKQNSKKLNSVTLILLN